MTKEVLFGKESRDKILKGVQKITDAVRVTMGSNGKCVLIGNASYGNDGLIHHQTLVSKDGWTVTRYFDLPDAIENRGAMMIKEAATKTVEMVGDATTCTCVLAESMITNGMKLIDGEGANSQLLKKGMDVALEYVIGELKKISTPVKGDNEKIKQIATVSSNNDNVIGQLIADAFLKIGDEGVITIEESKGIETEMKISEGFNFQRGWLSPFFVNNKAKETCEFEEALVLLYEKKITHHTQIQNAIVQSNSQRKPLLIICEDLEDEGLAFLAMNNYELKTRVCVVKSPEFGELRRECMEDIELLTGANFITDSKGEGIKDVTIEDFGYAKKVIVSKKETTIIVENNNSGRVEEFVNDLRMNLAQAQTDDERYPIEKRIARLTGGIAVIKVGAAIETELKEKMDRVDDAVRSTKAAIAEGFVAGGGTAFIRIENTIQFLTSRDTNSGIALVFDALTQPIKQICRNAGVDENEIYEKVSRETGDIGYNALTGEIENLVESGIIDSTKALRCALMNAVSVAGMVLTSECSIITTC